MEIKELLPFVCESEACAQEYHDAKGIGEIVKLWGMIFFTDGERSLLGLSCPKCKKTTLKMVESGAASKLLDDLRSPEIGKLFDFNWVIPFSANILRKHALITCPRIENTYGKFYVPEDFSIYKVHLFNRPWTNYPVDTFYHLHENNIPILLELENKKGYKAFPRLSEFSSVYHIYDYFLHEIAGFFRIDHYAKLVNSILSSRLEHYYQKIQRVELCIEENDPPYQVPNNLTLEEYDQMIQPGWIPSLEYAQIKKLYKFQEEYKIIRNRIDFEIIYKNAFLNKYFREFYHREGWREEVLSQYGSEDESPAPAEGSSQPAEFKNDGDEKEIGYKKKSAPSSADSDVSDISQQSEIKCEEDDKPENGPTSISDDSDASKAKMPTDQRIDENSPPSSPEIETEPVQQENNKSTPTEQKKVGKKSSLKTESEAVQDVEIESVPEDQKSDDNNIPSSSQIRSGDVLSTKSESIHAYEENGSGVSDASLMTKSKNDYDTEQESSKIISDAIQIVESDSKDDIRQKNQTTISKAKFEDSDSSLEVMKAEIEKSHHENIKKQNNVKVNYFVRQGDSWYVDFQGNPTTLRDLKRLRYVIHLLNNPNKKIDNMLLVNEFKMPEESKDKTEIEADESSYMNIESNYEDNYSKEDISRIEEPVLQLLDEGRLSTGQKKIEIEKELEKIKITMKKCGILLEISEDWKGCHFKFRTKELRKEMNKARINVRQNLNNAFEDICSQLPSLEKYLKNTIQTTQYYAIFSPGEPESSKFIEWTILGLRQ